MTLSRSRAALTALALVAATVTQVVGVVSPASAVATYRVLITGDSITQGSSGEYTWSYRLWNKLASTAPGEVSFVGTRTDLYDNVNDAFGSQYYAASFAAKSHAAKWGDAFANELDNVGGQVSSSGANVMVVMLGSNDLAYLTSPAATIANLKTYIERARVAKPGIDIVVGEVVNRYDPWSQAYTLTAEANDYAGRLQTLASQLNTSSQRVVIAPTRSGWDPRIHTWDGTHPNPTGEALIAQRVSQGLAQIGIGTSSPDVSGSRSWAVTGPGVSLTPGSEQIGLSWSRTSTGATGMLIETRLSTINEAWHRLPYAVGGGGWTSEGLAAGGTYQYRIVPSKGWNTGLAGATSTATATGPTPGAISTVTATAGGDSIYGGKQATVGWSASTYATGYVLSSRIMHNGTLSWDELPYPVTTRSWTWQPLAPGRRMQFRIQPVRGFLNGASKSSATTRIHGLPGNRVYTVLGDSYSSGLGALTDLGQYTGGSCRRTTEAWGYQMQSAFQSYTGLLACSGNVIAGVRGQMVGMNSAFAARAGKPQLITVTVGGNDVGFGDLAHDCIIGAGSCTQYEESTALSIDNLQPKLESLYTDIRSAQPYADILVGGYPNVVEPGGSGGWPNLCDAFGNNERDMAERLVIRLNSRIASAASSAGVWSVGGSVRTQFLGHASCTSGEWIHGPVRDGLGVSDISFHPNPGGQYAYALTFSNVLIARAG